MEDTETLLLSLPVALPLVVVESDGDGDGLPVLVADTEGDTGIHEDDPAKLKVPSGQEPEHTLELRPTEAPKRPASQALHAALLLLLLYLPGGQLKHDHEPIGLHRPGGHSMQLAAPMEPATELVVPAEQFWQDASDAAPGAMP